jgi:hypothetical protein
VTHWFRSRVSVPSGASFVRALILPKVMIVVPRTQLLRLMDVEVYCGEQERTYREKNMDTNTRYLYMKMMQSQDSIYGETIMRICLMVVEHNDQFRKAQPRERVSGMLRPVLLAGTIHLRDSAMYERITSAFRSLDEPTLKVIRRLPSDMPFQAFEPGYITCVAISTLV